MCDGTTLGCWCGMLWALGLARGGAGYECGGLVWSVPSMEDACLELFWFRHWRWVCMHVAGAGCQCGEGAEVLQGRAGG